MRFILRLLLVAFVVLLALVLGLYLLIDRGASAAVEKGVSYALAVPASVGGVKLQPFDGIIGIEELSISNPAGFSDQPMLGLKRALLHVQLSSLMGDLVEVQSFELDGVHLRLEGRGMKTNYGVIQENLARLGSGAGQPEKPAPEQTGSQKRFVIHDLVIRNTTVEVDYELDPALGKLGNGAANASIPEIHLENVGNGKSLSIAELSSVIFKALLEAAASGKLPGLSADVVKDLAKSLAEHPENAVEIGKGVESTLKGVKDLFKKN